MNEAIIDKRNQPYEMKPAFKKDINETKCEDERYEKQEPRIKRTRTLIINTFYELSKRKSCTQVTISSAIIAVFADTESVENLEEIYSKSVDLGIMPQEVKERQVKQISAGYQTISRNQKLDVALVDNGLVSMLFMLTAKAYGYDTNPIGGYDKIHIAETFSLNKERYVPVMIIAVGKAAEEGYSSYRLPVDSVVEWH